MGSRPSAASDETATGGTAGFVEGERADRFGIDRCLAYHLDRNRKAAARVEPLKDGLEDNQLMLGFDATLRF